MILFRRHGKLSIASAHLHAPQRRRRPTIRDCLRNGVRDMCWTHSGSLRRLSRRCRTMSLWKNVFWRKSHGNSRSDRNKVSRRDSQRHLAITRVHFVCFSSLSLLFFFFFFTRRHCAFRRRAAAECVPAARQSLSGSMCNREPEPRCHRAESPVCLGTICTVFAHQQSPGRRRMHYTHSSQCASLSLR